MFLKYSVIRVQKGIGLPSALFLILIIVLLIAAMNQLNQVNATALGREWLSLRAFYSAESAAQISAVQVLNSEQAMNTCNTNFITNQSFNNQGLSSCTANVSCEQVNVGSKIYYTLTSTGICGEQLDQAVRTIQIRIAP